MRQSRSIQRNSKTEEGTMGGMIQKLEIKVLEKGVQCGRVPHLTEKMILNPGSALVEREN